MNECTYEEYNPEPENEGSLATNETAVHRIGSDTITVESEITHNILFLNSFGSKIFKGLTRSDKNHIICSVDLFSSFALLYMASIGDTFSELEEFLELTVLERPYDSETIFKSIQSILQVLAFERFKIGPNYNIFNAIHLLIDQKAIYSEEYKHLIKRYFNVDIDRIDFERDWELIGDQITELIQNEFNSKNVKEFQSKIDKWTQVVILSAFRFKGKWDVQFPLDDISEDKFFNDGDKETTVKMMAIHQVNFRYVFITEWDSQVVEIPFAEKTMAFILILPKRKDGLDTLLERLDYKSLFDAIVSLTSTKCDVYLPKFRLDCDYDFAKLYTELKVFKSGLEMPKICADHKIKVNNILHKVVFEVNDNGVYAAIPYVTNSSDPQLIRADHPFVFVVKDMRTDVWLFFAKVNSLS